MKFRVIIQYYLINDGVFDKAGWTKMVASNLCLKPEQLESLATTIADLVADGVRGEVILDSDVNPDWVVVAEHPFLVIQQSKYITYVNDW